MSSENEGFGFSVEVETCAHTWKPKYAQGTIQKCIFCHVLGLFRFSTKTTTPQRCSLCSAWATRLAGRNASFSCVEHKSELSRIK